VLRYRQTHPDGTVVEAYWLTDLSARRVSPYALYRLAKGRWTIENQGFNDSKTRYGLDHVPHHHPKSLLIHWLLVALTLTLERLFRVRYLRRGAHPPLAAMDLLRRFRLALGRRCRTPASARAPPPPSQPAPRLPSRRSAPPRGPACRWSPTRVARDRPSARRARASTAVPKELVRGPSGVIIQGMC